MKRYPFIAALVATVILLSAVLTGGYPANVNAAAVKSFPDAVGFGSGTVGGRGGWVIYVTNLNDSGPGSFREAVSIPGPRTIVFSVSGTINLSRDINITEPFVTIAGQTAPGQGVQIKGGMVKIETHDVIIRYLKVREGNPAGGSAADTDSISVAGNNREVYNVIIDHSTLIWGTDIGGLSILTNAHDVTIQNSIIGEGLDMSAHPESPHSTGFNITQLNNSGYPTSITVYHNLITSSDNRNPQIIQAANVDMVNNVIYNWGSKSAYGNPKSLNLINNYYVFGPQSRSTTFWAQRLDADYPTANLNAVYESGNVAVGFTGSRGGPSTIYTGSPRFASSVGASSAAEAYNHVVANAGANRPVRDAVDQRIINNLTSRRMVLPNGGSGHYVNAADLVWPNLSGGSAPEDRDQDGMADSWEQQNFGTLSRGSPSNSSGDADGDGYTDLEEYLEDTNPGSGGIVPQAPTPTIVRPTSQITVLPRPTLQSTTQPTTQPTVAPTRTRSTQQPTAVPTNIAPSSSLAFTPNDDATVDQSNPQKNHGAEPTLRLSENPNIDFFIKFRVSGVNGQRVTKAVLRLFVLEGSEKGGRIKLARPNDWHENEITWKNKPDNAGDVIDSLREVQAGNWVEFDLTSAVDGDGTYSFRVLTPSPDAVEYSSKEGQNAPQLILTVSP